MILGIETSCDETGIGIVRGRTLLSNTIASSMDEHARFGGVVPEVAARARAGKWDYFQALQNGVFCELGKGCVDFAAVLRWARQIGYSHYLLVEQDILPGMGAPKESARRNREYLRSIESGKAHASSRGTSE